MTISAVDVSQLIVEEGVIVGIEEDGLWVETEKSSVCGSCAARSGCGQGLLARVGGANMMQVKVALAAPASGRFQVGQVVKIGVNSRALALSSLVLYLSPLIAMVVAAVLASSMVQPQWVIVVFAFAGFGVGAYLSACFSRSRRKDQRFHPVLVDC